MRNKNYMNKALTIIAVIFLSFFLFINIYYSQIINPLYFELINEDRKTGVEFLKKTIRLPEFDFIFKMAKNNYGNSLENEVFWQKKGRENEINKLERMLKTNQKAKDVLYGLYLENKFDGNEAKANEWLSKTRAVDPSL
jgi:hypothetical protein